MSAASVIVLNGTLKSDGSLELDVRPSLPPGRVRVALQPLPEKLPLDRLPDSPWLDECIPAPFDLPNPVATKRIQSRRVVERLPDPWQVVEKEVA